MVNVGEMTTLGQLWPSLEHSRLHNSQAFVLELVLLNL